MARLFTWNEIKKNGTVYPSPVAKLLNSKNLVWMRQVGDSDIEVSASGVSMIDYRVNDNAMPDLRWSIDAASAVNLEVNTDNTTNTTESILLHVSAQPQRSAAAYQKYFNPRYIYEVGDDVTGTGEAYVMYEEPQAQEATIAVYIVDETKAAIKAAANA